MGRGGVEDDFWLFVSGGVPIHSDRYYVKGAWVLSFTVAYGQTAWNFPVAARIREV